MLLSNLIMVNISQCINVYQIITLYPLNLHSVICEWYPIKLSNKAGKKESEKSIHNTFHKDVVPRNVKNSFNSIIKWQKADER